MLHDNNKQMRNVHKFDWSNGATIDQAKDMISYLVDKLQQAMSNPLLHAEVQGQLQAFNNSQLERGPLRPHGEGSKGGAPSRLEEEEEEQVLPLPQGHAHHNASIKKSGENDTSSSLDIGILRQGTKELRGALLLLREKGHLSILPNENLEEEATTLEKRRRGRGHHPLPLLHLHHRPPAPCPRRAPSLPHP